MVWHGTSARAADLLQRPLAVNVPLEAGDEPQRYISAVRSPVDNSRFGADRVAELTMCGWRYAPAGPD